MICFAHWIRIGDNYLASSNLKDDCKCQHGHNLEEYSEANLENVMIVITLCDLQMVDEKVYIC